MLHLFTLVYAGCESALVSYFLYLDNGSQVYRTMTIGSTVLLIITHAGYTRSWKVLNS